MSKDTINPKRYTVVEKLGKDLKEGDEIWESELGTWETPILKWKDNEPFKSQTFLCRVPSSPVMSFEEFIAKWYPNNATIDRFMERYGDKVKKEYEGYLIGTRSIVPEIKEDKILVIVKDSIEKWKEAKDVSTHQTMANYITQRIYNWLRSQINK